MAVTRPLLGLISIILNAGAVVLQFFIILSGAINSSPENLVYFLQASSNNVQGANDRYRNPARWTYWSICGVDDNGYNVDCTRPVTPALPFDPARNFGTSSGFPDELSSSYYFYMSRFAWAFFLIALVFSAITFLISVLALCTRLGAYLSGLTISIAFFFQALAAALTTVWVVKAHQALTNNNQDAEYGRYGLAFAWTPVACFMLGTVLFCIGGSVGKNEGGKSYFGRKSSTRSRGSFIDSEEKGRHSVRDEYE